MYQAIEAAYPHLIRALRLTCHLTKREAVETIYDHRYAGGCGIACANIRRAIRYRDAHRPVHLAEAA